MADPGGLRPPRRAPGVGGPAGATAMGWLRSHPAPRFLVVGGLTFLVDISGLKIGHDVLGLSLAAATAAAFALAFVVNFGLSRQWVFVGGRQADARWQAVRFTILVAANLVSTLIVVVGLAQLGVYYLLAKLVAAAVNAGANFFLYRRWVFR